MDLCFVCYVIQTSSIPLYERMWQAMSNVEPSVFVAHTVEGVERVRESGGKYAYLLESTTNDYFNQRSPCDTVRVGALLNSIRYGIAVKKESPLR